MKRRNSLKSKIATTLIVMLLSFTLALLIVIRSVSKIAIQNFIYNDIYSRQYEMYDGFSMVLDEVNLLYSRMVLNDQFMTVLQDDHYTNEEKQAMYQNLMNTVGMNYDLFGDVVIYYNDSVYRLASPDLGLAPPSTAFVSKMMQSTNLIEQGDVTTDIQGNHYLTIGKRMINYPTSNVLGSVYFYVNEKVLRDFCNSISSDLGYTFVIADDQTIITNSNGDKIGSTLFDVDLFTFTKLPNYEIRTVNNEKSIIIVNQLSDFNNRYDFNWKIVSVISYDTLFEDIIQLNNYIIILGLVMAILAAFVSLRISVGITKPINKIIRGLRKFSLNGEKAPFENNDSKDELWELEYTYDEMINRIAELIEKNNTEMENKRKLELYALQMQINPHFLYNTLDAIAWMAKIKKQSDIEKLVLALAKFFRISLHKGDKFITVSEEIELIHNFIEIELIRFPNKFTIDYQVTDEAKNEETLKLILQPIVENAIKHGISQLDHQGHIQINVCKEENMIIFEVIDDGMGFLVSDDLFSPARLTLSGGGYGLKNVDERIKLEYGRECGVTVTSKPNGGTKVTIKIKSRRDV